MTADASMLRVSSSPAKAAENHLLLEPRHLVISLLEGALMLIIRPSPQFWSKSAALASLVRQSRT